MITVSLSRREFVLSSLFTLAVPAVWSQQNPVSVKFGMVTDPHYADREPAGTRFYRESLQKMREIARLEFIPILNLTHQAFEIANEIQHDLYDCIYLALAIHQQSVMVTADKKFYDCVQKHDVYKDFIQWIEDELKIMK